MGAKIEKIIVTTKLFLLYFQKKSPGEISSPLKGEYQIFQVSQVLLHTP